MKPISLKGQNMKTVPRHFTIIDDDADDREIFMSAITEIAPDITCSTVDNAEAFLAAVDENDNLPDVIFLDINMPGMDGFKFLSEAAKRNILGHTKVVIYSTSTNYNDFKKAQSLGAHGFITKTNTYTELCTVLKDYISKAEQ